MQYAQPQQAQIPYDRLLIAPMQFPLNQPPCQIPIQTSQSLAGYNLALTALCANDAGARVASGQPSPVRVIFWNLVSANGFQNETFFELVNMAADLLLHYMVSGQGGFSVPDQAIGPAATYANNICASLLFMRMPGLQSIVPPQQVNEAQQILSRAGEIQGSVRQIKQQNGIPFNPNQNTGNSQPVMQPMQQYGGMMTSQPVAYSQPGNYAQPQQSFRHDNRPVGGSPVLTMPNNQPAVSSPTDRYVAAAAVPVSLASTAVNAAPAVVQSTTTTTMAPVAKVEGYFMARNAGKDMDRKKHTIVTTAQRAFAMKPEQRARLLENAVENLLSAKQELAATVANGPEEPEEKEKALREIMSSHNYTAKPSGEILNLSYLDATISEMRRGQMTEFGDEGPADILQRTAIIAEPFVCSAQTADKLREVTKSTKLGEFASRLKQLMTNPDNTAADRLALLQLDAYLTYEINSLLANGLSLTTSTGHASDSLDSFADDVPPTDTSPGLMRHVENKHGYTHSRALAVFQGEWIGAHCDMVARENVPEYAGEAWGEDAVVFDRRYSITLVNVLASELDVDFVAPCANAILESEFPVLFKLIHDTMATYEDEGQAVACHLLITADNQRFRMHRGLIGNKFVLLERLPR